MPPQQREGQAEQNDGGDSQHVQNDAESGHPHLTERQKKLFELRLKMVMQIPNYYDFHRLDIVIILNKIK